MKRFTSVVLALASLALGARGVGAARPRYGGTLRVEMAETIRSLNPATPAADAKEASARSRVQPLVFETLTRIDGERGLQPSLAVSWESDTRGSRWRLRLRSGVTLHDGSTLEPWQAAAALRAVETRWSIATDGDTVIIDLPEANISLPWLLAESNHAVSVRTSTNATVGTGPFRLDHIDAAAISLRANDDYRDGRPFVDAVTILMGRPLPAQLSDLDAGRADIVSVQPTDTRRLAQRGMSIAASRPLELVALVFEPHRAGDSFEAARRSIANALNKPAICNVLLQQQGEAASGLLPSWLSGYTGRFGAGQPSLSRAAAAALPPGQRDLIVRVDASDPLARAIAERVAVDAREAGFSFRLQEAAGLAPRADARLVRVRVPAALPERALAAAVDALPIRASASRPTVPIPGASLDEAYRAEAELLDKAVIVPVVHLPETYGLAEQIEVFRAGPILASGVWNFGDVSIMTLRP
jgi:peptide/nickel transport system substrate-binding protein